LEAVGKTLYLEQINQQLVVVVSIKYATDKIPLLAVGVVT
jgi:hypothetical protein